MRIRVLHVHNYSNWGGNLEHVRLVLNGLQDDFELFLAAPRGESYLQRFDDRVVTKLHFEARSRADFPAAFSLAKLVRAHEIQVIHSHLRRTDWACAWARAQCPGRKWVTTVHGEPNLGPDFRRQTSVRNWVYRVVLARTFHRVLAVSVELAARLETVERVQRAKIQTLTNGIDTNRFSPPGQREKGESRQHLSLRTDRPIMVMVGRFGKRKGHEVLFSALAKERKEGRPWTLLLVGDGDLEEHLRQAATQCGLAEDVVFCGFQEDVAPFYEAASVVVMPSFSEGLPRALLEGMSMGLAPVVTDIAGHREVVSDESIGLQFPVGDEEMLAARLAWLHTNPVRRRALGVRASEVVSGRYSSARLIEQHRQLYRELAAGDVG